MVTLEKIISGDDDRLAFQAMKIMNTSDSEKAVKIADRIIQNYNGIVTDKVRAAIKVKASYLANSSTKTERVEFINFCDNILLKDSRKNGDVVSDTIIFALSDVMSEETISYIVSSDKIDRTAKVFCVDQNYRVLKSMLLENLSERNLDIVIQAMKICPLKEMAEPLQGIGTEQLLQLSSSAGEITKEIGKVLDLVNESGISATDKY